MVGPDQTSPTGCHAQQVCFASEAGQVARARVAHRDGGIGIDEQQRERHADNRAATDDHRAYTAQWNFVVLEEPQAAQRGCWRKAMATLSKTPEIGRVLAVHVLGGIDCSGC